MADAQPPSKHRWLRWVGLEGPEAPPVDPDAWMPVVSDLGVDDADTGFSEQASKVADALKTAAIETRRRAYVLTDGIGMGRVGLHLLGPGPAPADRIRVAVMVHNRDLARAAEVLAGLDLELDRPGAAQESPSTERDD